MSRSDPHFPKMRFHQSIWLYSNLMYLHDMLYGFLGMIKFDIKLVVLYFFLKTFSSF